jgi:hypothetical protein
LGHSEEFPLFPTDISNVYAHVECGAYVNETRVEIVPIFGPRNQHVVELNDPEDMSFVAETSAPSKTTQDSKTGPNHAVIKTERQHQKQDDFHEEYPHAIGISYIIVGVSLVPEERKRLVFFY